MLDRPTATQRLNGTRDAFWFSLGAYALLTEEPSRSQLAAFSIQISELNTIYVSQGTASPSKGKGTTYTIGFNAGLDRRSAQSVVEHSFRQMLLQSFETTKEYAKESGLKLSGESWYEFARHYRNAVAHNGKWDIRAVNGTVKGLPLTWKNKTVVASLHGTPIDGYLNWYEGLQLCAQMINFVSLGIR
jgi:hypothetical protein